MYCTHDYLYPAFSKKGLVNYPSSQHIKQMFVFSKVIRAPPHPLPPSVPARFSTLTPEFLSGRLDDNGYLGSREMHTVA